MPWGPSLTRPKLEASISRHWRANLPPCACPVAPTQQDDPFLERSLLARARAQAALGAPRPQGVAAGEDAAAAPAGEDGSAGSDEGKGEEVKEEQEDEAADVEAGGGGKKGKQKAAARSLWWHLLTMPGAVPAGALMLGAVAIMVSASGCR